MLFSVRETFSDVAQRRLFRHSKLSLALFAIALDELKVVSAARFVLVGTAGLACRYLAKPTLKTGAKT